MARKVSYSHRRRKIKARRKTYKRYQKLHEQVKEKYCLGFVATVRENKNLITVWPGNVIVFGGYSMSTVGKTIYVPFKYKICDVELRHYGKTGRLIC